jgi:hypothetical protein
MDRWPAKKSIGCPWCRRWASSGDSRKKVPEKGEKGAGFIFLYGTFFREKINPAPFSQGVAALSTLKL